MFTGDSPICVMDSGVRKWGRGEGGHRKINIGLCLDNYWPVSVKLGVITSTTGLYVLKPAWMNLTYIQDHRSMIHISIIWICVISRVRLGPRPSVMLVKDFNVERCIRLYSQFFIPTMLIGTIDFYHFIPLSVILTMVGGHKVSAKQNLLASFSCTPLIWLGWKLIWYCSESSSTFWYNFCF